MTATDIAVYLTCGLAFLIPLALYARLEWKAVCRFTADLGQGVGQ